MKVAVLGSGSKGNSIFLESKSSKILIDVGFSGIKIENKLKEIKKNVKDINGILITHEHNDHIMGAGILSRRFDIPIFISKESYEVSKGKIGKIEGKNLNFIENKFNLNDLTITPIDVKHDAVRTFAFKIETLDKKIGIATDIGYIDNIFKESFKELDLLIIESNYDFDKLMNCEYPWPLKMRVKSNNGHLDNRECVKLIKEIYSKKLKTVICAHVSKDSNCYNLVEEYIKKEISELIDDLELIIAKQDIVTKLIDLEC